MKNPFAQLYKVTVLIAVSFILTQVVYAQNEGHIEEEYDHLTAQWLEVSGELKTYSGLTTFCKSAEYSTQTIGILEALHHYDSIVLDIMKNNPINHDVSHREYKKTSKDIGKFETEYGIKGSCNTRKDLEKNKKELMKESGMYSYDGQLLVLETQLIKFLKHIDKRVVSIDNHLHMIHPDQIQPVLLLTKK